MSNIIVELDSVKKYSNKSEYRRIPRARCQEFDLEVEGDGYIVTKLAKLLAEKNADISRGLEVRRGDTLCFHIKPLKTWVEKGPDRRPEHLKRK